ncbi:MAG: NAD(P)H-dependent oxidoreductase [Proteobacteria bacterium]|nr:NAD(P)H-dependent oxidoreductase [Pseudomonadota bacterium]MDA1311524.1 NAD(P)H-dependent oxidoreductase [Pseudomonadota bacterium]
MQPKRIYILNGHPAETSLNRTLAEAYATAAIDAGHEVRLTHLNDLTFDPDFEFGGYQHQKPLEPALEQVLDDIAWSQHLVLTTPMWWGGLPAKLKGLFDRAFLPGRTFNTRETDWMGMPTPMLSGRTGRIIMTSDTPGWFMRWVYHNAMLRQIRDQILGFVGIKPARITHFSGASQPKPGVVDQWGTTVKKFGVVGA